MGMASAVYEVWRVGLSAGTADETAVATQAGSPGSASRSQAGVVGVVKYCPGGSELADKVPGFFRSPAAFVLTAVRERRVIPRVRTESHRIPFIAPADVGANVSAVRPGGFRPAAAIDVREVLSHRHASRILKDTVVHSVMSEVGDFLLGRAGPRRDGRRAGVNGDAPNVPVVIAQRP